jgi:hypothetical protein
MQALPVVMWRWLKDLKGLHIRQLWRAAVERLSPLLSTMQGGMRHLISS